MKLELTNDAKAFVAVLYREYCTRRNHGMSIEAACHLGDDISIQESFAPKMLLDDVTHLCWLLAAHGILSAFPGDDRANDVAITDAGIAYMEQRFPRGISDALEFLGKIAALVPWLL